MAEAIADALGQNGKLVVEAGTGTGKTFAYLLPALMSGRKTIISTGTKALQDQLYHRDLPLIGEAVGRPVTTALLKGRANYLCLHRLDTVAGHSAAGSVAADLDQVATPVRVEPRLLQRSVRTCLGDWRGLLTRQTRHGRDFLRKVLTGPIAFASLIDGASRGYQFEGEASIGQLLSGVIELPTSVASPTGHTLMWKPTIRGTARRAA